MEVYYFKGDPEDESWPYPEYKEKYGHIQINLSENTTIGEIYDQVKTNGYPYDLAAGKFNFVDSIENLEFQTLPYGINDEQIYYHMNSDYDHVYYLKFSGIFFLNSIGLTKANANSTLIFHQSFGLGASLYNPFSWIDVILKVSELSSLGSETISGVGGLFKKRALMREVRKFQNGRDADMIEVDQFLRILSNRGNWRDNEIHRLSKKLNMDTFIFPVMELLEFQRLDDYAGWKRIEGQEADEARANFINDPLKFIDLKMDTLRM